MNTLTIAIIGAGSRCFSKRSIGDILLSDALNECELELRLMDIVPEHLDAPAEFARVAADALNRVPRVRTTTDLAEAVDAADFVVAAIEVDRDRYWTQDFHVPRLHGSDQIYGENGGPGGAFHALRNMRPILDIAHAMEKGCPDAWLLNFSNPESKLCEALNRVSRANSVGLCHGVSAGMRQIAQFLELPVERLDTQACGINHFTWFQTIRDRETGADLYPLLREKERAAAALAHWDKLALGRVLLRAFGLWPSPGGNHYGEYIRWAGEFVAVPPLHFYYDPGSGHPWATGTVPERVFSIDGNPTHRPLFPPPTRPADTGPEAGVGEIHKSGEMLVPIMEGLVTGEARDIAAVVVENHGAIPNLPGDMTVEVPATADGNGLHPQQMAPLPEGIAAMIRLQGSIQKLLVEAFAERSRNKLVQAVLLDPTVKSYRGAVAMIDELLSLQQDLLPEFS